MMSFHTIKTASISEGLSFPKIKEMFQSSVVFLKYFDFEHKP